MVINKVSRTLKVDSKLPQTDTCKLGNVLSGFIIVDKFTILSVITFVQDIFHR